MSKKIQNPLKNRPYKKKYRCQNCKGFTDSWGIVGTKYYCQKCLLYRRNHFNKFPTPKMVQQLKEVGLWKK